jgi:8-amino-7-oxononanoate synthase
MMHEQPVRAANGNASFIAADYLGFARHPVTTLAAKAAIDRYGTSFCIGRYAIECPLHRELEIELARWLGHESCVIAPSGYAANLALLMRVAGPRDLICHDRLAHNSIIAGARLSGAERLSFAHNQWQELDQLLAARRSSVRQVFIVTEGLFSADGDSPPLQAFVDVAQRRDARLILDEAHSLGTLGATGRGAVEQQGVERRAFYATTGSLGKALASGGGYIAGSAELVDRLKQSAPPLLYTTGIPVSALAAALASLHLLEAEPRRLSRLSDNIATFTSAADRAGLTLTGHPYPIQPVIIGDENKAQAVAGAMTDIGIAVLAMRHPAVPRGEARLRFLISSEHTDQHLQAATDACARIASRC